MALKVLDRRTNKIVELSDDQVTNAIASGQYLLQKGIRVPVVSPDGVSGTIDSSEAHKLFKSGFTYESEAQREERKKQAEFGNRPIAAGAAAVARGLTIGLSDPALTKSGLVESETLRELEERNPEASIAGEVFGTVAPLALSGGTSLIAKGVQVAGKGVTTVARTGLATEKATASLLAKTLKASGKSSLAQKVISKTAPKVAGSAVEGAFYGAGHILSEEALGRADLNAESLISSVGMGALIGGAAGGVFSVAGLAVEGTGALAKKGANKTKTLWDKLTGKPLRDAENKNILDELTSQVGQKADDIAERQAAADRLQIKLTQAMESDSYLDHKLEGFLADSPIFGIEIRKQLNEARGGIQKNAHNIFENASKRTQKEVGDSIVDDIIDEIDNKYDTFKSAYEDIKKHRPYIAPNERSLLATAKNIQSFARGPSGGSKGSDIIRYADEYADRLLMQETVEDLAKLASELKADARAFRRAGDKREFMAREIGRRVDSLYKRTIRREAIALGRSGIEGAEETAFQLLKKIESTDKEYSKFIQFINQLGKATKINWKGGVETFKDRLREIDGAKIAERLFDKKNVSQLEFFKSKFPKQFEELRLLEKAKILKNSMSEGSDDINIPKLLKSIFDDKRLSPEVRQMIFTPDELQTLSDIAYITKKFPKVLNPSGTDIRKDLGMILKMTLHVRDAGLYALYKGLGRNLHTTEELTVRHIDDLANVERAKTSIERTINKTINKFIKGAELVEKVSKPVSARSLLNISFDSEKYKKSEESKEKAFEKRSKEISELISNPEKLISLVANRTARLQSVAPNTAAIVSERIMTAVHFLYSKLPQNPAAARSSNLAIRKWKPSSVEIAKFDRYLKAVDDPMSVIKDLERGKLNREGVETLQNVYPEIYGEIVKTVMDQVAELRVNMPYPKRLLLSTLLNVPIDLAQEPQYLMSLQSTYQMDQDQSQQSSIVRPTVGGAKQLNIADRQITETQRITNKS